MDRAWAEDAQVLPKGVNQVGVRGIYYPAISQRYDPNGHHEDVAHDLNTTLGGAAFGLPAGTSLGVSHVTFSYDFRVAEFNFNHGVTDRLTLGAKVPYRWAKNHVTASVDSSAANIGKIPVAPYLGPIALGATPLTTEDVQNLIGAGLDTTGDGIADVPGFGYKRVQSWSDSGFTDIDVGGRYQYHNSKTWRLAFTGGVRIPTGKVDDPDNLVDKAFGDGTYSILLGLNNDYVALERWKFDATFTYDAVLPDRQTMRVPTSVNDPVALNKEKVKRNLGDIYGVDLSTSVAVTKAVGLSADYTFKGWPQATYSGTRGYAYHSLEAESDGKEHTYTVALSYSTVPHYMETKSGIPMVASLSYWNRFAGSGNVYRADYLAVTAAVYF